MSFSDARLSRYLQTQESECGLMSLAACAEILGVGVSASEARQWFPGSVRGMSIGQICERAEAMGMVASAFECKPEELAALPTPAIVHWRSSHFCVLLGCSRGGAKLFDPARGIVRADAAELREAFSGAAIALSREQGSGTQGARRPGLVRLLWQYSGSARPQIVLLLGLSLVMQLAFLALPLLSQVAINFGAMQGNLEVITVVAVSMLVLQGISFLVEAWRGRINHLIASVLSASLSRQMFRHLLHLPVAWFERRRVADVVNRFESVDPIRTAVSAGLVSLVVDAALGLAVAGVLLLISPWLGLLVLATVAATAVVRALFAPAVAAESAQACTAKVHEQAKRWETFRSVGTLKLACAEGSQDRAWSDRMDKFLLHNERSQQLTTWQQSTASLLNGVGSVLVIFVGARMVAEGGLSIGGLFAFVMYRRYLSDRVGAAVDQLSNVWSLRHHHERLQEVLEAERERRWNDQRDTGASEDGGAGLVLRRLGFRHSPADPMLLRDLDASFQPGQTIFITGPSGAGKTSLLRLVAGLATPSTGAIELDGVPTANLSPRQLRGQMAAVLQDDEIFAGSIFENVSMFAEAPDLGRAIEALTQACFWDEVKALPMGIHTPVGEVGRLLSAGQRQRVLLARAFYRQPRLLLLDEATANLDPATQSRVLENLRAMPATKLLVSHDMRLSAQADRTFVLDGRGLREFGRKIDLAEVV